MILFTAQLSSDQQEQLKKSYPNETFQFCQNIDEAERFIHSAEVIVTYGSDLTTPLIKAAAKLEWIMVLSAGIDQMPLDMIKQRNILVTNARGIHKVPMAEYAISMLLQVYRQEKTIIKNEEQSIWNKRLKMLEISGKTILIVGTGSIGQEVARLAKAFRMKTLGISRSGTDVEFIDTMYRVDELDSVLSQADFIVSILPGTNETKQLFTSKQFAQMQNHAVFLNMGRGEVVKEADLLKAIKEKEFAHAVLDVFDSEPLRKDHPFWQEENITVTPHLSGVSSEYLPRALEIFSKNLQVHRAKQDSYINKINVERGY